MKKSLLAVAVAAALPAFAYAQTNVTLSGLLKTGITQTKYSNGGTNDGNHTALNDGASRFVISGTEDLGGGLKGIFQIDNRFRPDSGAGSVATGATFVGLSGGFGTVRLGKIDLYYIDGMDLFAVYSTPLQHSNISIMSYVNDTLGGAGTIARTSRSQNVVRYDSPNFGGISGSIAWSPGAATTEGAPGDAQKGDAFYGRLGYAAGPLSVGASMWDEKFEGHKTMTAGNTGQSAWRLYGKYNFGMFSVGLLYDESTLDYAGASDVERKAWSVPVTAKLGPGTLLFTYSQADDLDGTSDTGAKMYALGYDYPLSKRTSLSLSYSVVNNDSNAKYGYFTGAALNDLSRPLAGQDQKQLALGVLHRF